MFHLEDKTYRYVAFFEPKTGVSGRSNVIGLDGEDTGEDPFMGSFPDLLDVGIMGHCAHGLSGKCAQSGVQCYQEGGHKVQTHLTFDQFKSIIDQAQGRTFQVALGGRGDPDMHPDILKILSYAYNHDVIPNFTTSGHGLSDELLPAIKQYCGAVAVSWYRNETTLRTIEKLVSYGIRTNIHYVISNSTLDEAIDRMENDTFPKGVNRIIFLLHKPVGYGQENEVLSVDDPKVQRFFKGFDQPSWADKSGFDSCGVPALTTFTSALNPLCLESCEAGRFSAYISPDFKLIPCSFEQDPEYAVSLETQSIEEAWNSEPFNRFRQRHQMKCIGCPHVRTCGACPIVPQTSLCTHQSLKGDSIHEDQSRLRHQFIL